MLGHVGGDEGELRAHVFAAHCAKKAEALRKTSTSSFRRLLSWRSRASSPASACCCSIAEAESADSSSSRHVFNCVGVTPSSAATLACVAPGAKRRATACSLYSGENRRLICLVITSLQIGRTLPTGPESGSNVTRSQLLPRRRPRCANRGAA